MNTLKQLLQEADPLRNEPVAPEAERERHRQAILAAASQDASATYAARPRFLRFATVALVALGILFLATRVKSPIVLESHASVRFEIRLAEDEPGPGLREAFIQGSKRVIYLHQEAVITNEDIARAELAEGPGPSQYGVSVEFTPAGAEKSSAAARSHEGKRLAILVDDEVVIAPTVRGPLGPSVWINGNYTREQAERIVNGMGAH